MQPHNINILHKNEKKLFKLVNTHQ